MLYLTDGEIEGLITIEEMMEAVDRAFREQGAGTAPLLPRRRVALPEGKLNVMSGALHGQGFAGVKAYTIIPGAGNRHLFFLWDARTSEFLSVMEAGALGRLRTGAASGVAAHYMAREDARVAGLFGTGRQADAQLLALCAARPLERVRVFSRRAENRAQFLARMKERVTAELVPAESPAEAVRGAQIVCTITKAGEPVFDGRDLEPGTTVIAAGSNQPGNREVDDETFRRAAAGRIATDSLEGTFIESGDFLRARAANAVGAGQLIEIGLIAAGVVPGRGSLEEINLFLSQGVCIEDVAAGAELYRRAREKGAGTELPLPGMPG